MGRCSIQICTIYASISVSGKTTPAYCKRHALDGMVDFRNKRCSHETCMRRSSFNVKGFKEALFCGKHAGDGMVSACNKRCSQGSCTTRPVFKVEGSKAGAHCRRHSGDGMVNVISRRCSRATCARIASFRVVGSDVVDAFCKEHAEGGMVNAARRRCLHDTCAKKPCWGLLDDGAPTTCTGRKGGILGDPVVHLSAQCMEAGCRRYSTWRLVGKQPSHCGVHGPLTNGLALTVRVKRISRAVRTSSSVAVGRPLVNMKVECEF